MKDKLRLSFTVEDKIMVKEICKTCRYWRPASLGDDLLGNSVYRHPVLGTTTSEPWGKCHFNPTTLDKAEDDFCACWKAVCEQ